MNFAQLHFIAVLGWIACTSVATMGADDQGAAGLFVIDLSPPLLEMKGECVKYTLDAVPGPHKRFLTIAKGAEHSFVLVVAFDVGKDSLHRNLPPVTIEQVPGSLAARFPEEGGAVWPFDRADEAADLFVMICTLNDPVLPGLRKNIDGLKAAVRGQQADVALLQASALRTRLTATVRSRSASAEARIAPTSIAAIRRGLANLGEDWKADSAPLSYSNGHPGVLLFKVGKRS